MSNQAHPVNLHALYDAMGLAHTLYGDELIAKAAEAIRGHQATLQLMDNDYKDLAREAEVRNQQVTYLEALLARQSSEQLDPARLEDVIGTILKERLGDLPAASRMPLINSLVYLVKTYSTLPPAEVFLDEPNIAEPKVVAYQTKGHAEFCAFNSHPDPKHYHLLIRQADHHKVEKTLRAEISRLSRELAIAQGRISLSAQLAALQAEIDESESEDAHY